MKKLIFLLLIFTSILTFAQNKKVYLAYIEGDIDLGISYYVSRAVAEAEKNEADAIVFHINTFGGRVDAATQIKDAILESKILTIAFVNKRAISAGALITLSCQKIAMVEGSSIGASTVVDQSGQKQSEKYQSYMRSEMRATAERHGRRKDVAEGMVDERVVIEGLVDSTQLVTLTSDEAYEYGITDTVVNTVYEVLKKYGLEDAKVINLKSSWAEDVIRFINNPVISSILIMIGFLGLMTEVKTPGWGLPGTAGVVALAIFFGSSYLLELTSILEISLFILGLALLAVEVFVIPGFGFAGISGIILIVVSIFLSLIGGQPFIDSGIISMAVIQLASALGLSVVAAFLLAKFLPKSSTFNKLVLSQSETPSEGFTSHSATNSLVGKFGKTISPLRPAGKAEINDEILDVVTRGEYVETNVPVKIIQVEGIRIVVKEVKD